MKHVALINRAEAERYVVGKGCMSATSASAASDDALCVAVAALQRPNHVVTNWEVRRLLGCWIFKANRVMDELSMLEAGEFVE